jgi:hypothetical protein
LQHQLQTDKLSDEALAKKKAQQPKGKNKNNANVNK